MTSTSFTITLQADFFLKDKLQIFLKKYLFSSHLIPCLTCATFIYCHAEPDVNATVEANAVLLNSHRLMGSCCSPSCCDVYDGVFLCCPFSYER